MRTAFKRAAEFSDIARLVQWHVSFVVPTHACKPAEVLAHRYLDASFERHLSDRQELWEAPPEPARELCIQASLNTPAPLRAARLDMPKTHCVALENPEAWKLALAMPLSSKRLSPNQLTLAEVLSLCAAPGVRHAAEALLNKAGIELIRFDPVNPRFRLYADSDGPLSTWLHDLGLNWESLECSPGRYLDASFLIQPLA